MMNRTERSEKSVAFLTLGCKVNSYETDGMEKLFTDAGYTVKGFDEKASVYVINTCTVTNIADRKSRQMLHKAKKLNPDGIVVAAGCYAQASKETLELDEAIDVVVGNNQKKNIVDIVENYMVHSEENEAVLSIEQEQEYEELTIDTVGEKTRAYIKIQDGCNQFCSYCIIPYARGRVRSRKAEDILLEVHRITENGYKEVVLTGIHLSSYGIDFKKGSDGSKDQAVDAALGVDYQNGREKYHNAELLDLITAISQIEGIERIRLGSLEPRIITDEFASTLAKNRKFCPHFHLSLQSGCNATLKAMNRRYTAEEYYEKCELLRKYFDNPAITTDVIVGFPGETTEDFEESRNFLEKVNFAQMHIFKYSKRKGTRAESMPNQVPEPVKAERSNQLIALEAGLNRAYKDSFMDSVQKILVEETIELDGVSYQTGHNERYIRLAYEGSADDANSIVDVKVTGYLNDEILLCKRMD